METGTKFHGSESSLSFRKELVAELEPKFKNCDRVEPMGAEYFNERQVLYSTNNVFISIG